MRKDSWFFLTMIILLLLANSSSAQSPAEAGFMKLKALAGEWQGVGPNDLQISVTYEILSGGRAVMETRKPVNEPSMVTVFHLDGETLMMTHYCSIGNQPRMRANPENTEIKELDFAFLDVTNLVSPSQGHMRHLKLTFPDENSITQVWTWREDGKDMPASFSLKRKE